MSAQWYCRVAGQEKGPFTAQQLKELAARNEIQPTDAIRKADTNWVPAANVKGLFPPEPRSNSTVSSVVSDATADWSAPKPAIDRAPEKPPVAVAAKPVIEQTADMPSKAGSSIALDDPSGSNSAGASQVIRELVPGSTLGNYVIQSMLGQGGMGVVLKAHHKRMDRMVALKVLKREATSNATAVKRFQQEVRAAAKLSHPNIVTAYDADEVQGIHFLVMEYVDGTCLADLLSKSNPLPIKDVLTYVLQSARGLEYAHAEGIIHRDIKPGNLLVDKKGVVKILDMGLASMKETSHQVDQQGNESVTQARQLLGTFDYMPPEQAVDAHSVDHRADIYSLGCTLYRLLTGRVPYGGDAPLRKIFAHRDDPIPSIRSIRQEVSYDIDRLFKRMVAKKPDDRHFSMAEVIQDLERCMTNRPLKAPKEDDLYGLLDDEPRSRHPSASGILKQEEMIRIAVPTDSSDDEDEFHLAPTTGVDRYYWKVMGQDTGPFTLDQLRKKYLDPDDQLRHEDSMTWKKASQIKGLLQ